MPHPLRCLFAVWMVCVTTGSVVVHPGAGAGHTHGFGWASLQSGCSSSGCTHRHFVLLGVESWADDAGETPEGTRGVLGDCSAPDGPTDAPAFGDLGALVLVRDIAPPRTAHAPADRAALNATGRATHISSTILRL